VEEDSSLTSSRVVARLPVASVLVLTLTVDAIDEEGQGRSEASPKAQL
jgi:hypothetical protein